MQLTFTPFDVNTVALEGKNLVEASAGTGKTFSIGILTLRLVCEKGIPIEKILLVTFTKNAVAELEGRIRVFVRNAHDYAVNNDTTVAGFIKTVVDGAVVLEGADTVKQRLKDALLFLDQLSVMTIHSFCQQTLNDLAFETGQLFGSEIITSLDETYMFYVNDFWRNNITTLPVNVYAQLITCGLTQHSLRKVIENFFAGKVFFQYEPGTSYQIVDENREQALAELEQQIENLKLELLNEVIDNVDSYRQAMEGNRNTKNQVSMLEQPAQLIEFIEGKLKKSPQYVEDLFPVIIQRIQKRQELEEELAKFTKPIVNNVYCLAIEKIAPEIETHLNTAGQMSFDGLIGNLYKAIQGANRQIIVRALQAKYKAVFIDEFQDTDKLQYAIFKTAFADNHDTILFYIGDPKQSIYSFRQADINTYLAARNEMDHCYSMNINYRSSARVITALNHFFLSVGGAEAFKFEGGENGIKYISGDTPAGQSKPDLIFNGQPCVPLSIETWKEKGSVKKSVVHKIFELLTGEGYRLGGRRIRPSDIGILVKDGKYGKEIKDLLSRKDIPAVFINDDKIMESAEADSLYHLLRAIHDPTIENIRTGLLNNFTGIRSDELVALRGEELAGLFRKYKALWESDGINQALSAWMNDFGIGEYLIRPDTTNGLRTISNLEQLKELLIKTEYLQRLKPDELLDWMKRAKDLELLGEDESVIRLESDADAVTISTIHKAKGLQYPIVFSPQSNLVAKALEKMQFVSIFKDGNYWLVPSDQLEGEMEEKYLLQNEQERRRLLYVALTRTISACFIYGNSFFNKPVNRPCLPPFLEALKVNGDEELIQITENEKWDLPNDGLRYTPGEFTYARPERLNSEFSVRNPDWRFMSYSALSEQYAFAPQIAGTATKESYDDFVFEQLRKGNITGTMIHEILERINFGEESRWPLAIQNAIDRYAASRAELYNEWLPQLLKQVLNSRIEIPGGEFRLSQIPHSNRLHEVEFDFPVGNFDTAALTAICKNAGIDISVLDRSNLYGMMNGFIDMFFEFDGMFYVLDWKSNFLGNRKEFYTGVHLENAMTQNNYHLQYIIYTLAVAKYLRLRKPGFNYERDFGGVIYCFLRGMRAGEASGVYFKKLKRGFVEEVEELMGVKEVV